MLPEATPAGLAAAHKPRNLPSCHNVFADTEPGAPAPLPARPPDTGVPGLDLEEVTQAVLHSLVHAVPRERVQQLLAVLLEQEFSDVRVTQFLPLFLHRAACETVRSEAAAQRLSTARR